MRTNRAAILSAVVPTGLGIAAALFARHFRDQTTIKVMIDGSFAEIDHVDYKLNVYFVDDTRANVVITRGENVVDKVVRICNNGSKGQSNRFKRLPVYGLPAFSAERSLTDPTLASDRIQWITNIARAVIEEAPRVPLAV